MRLTVAAVLLSITVGSSPLDAAEPIVPKQGSEYTVAVYYWPNFHRDAYHQSKMIAPMPASAIASIDRAISFGSDSSR